MASLRVTTADVTKMEEELAALKLRKKIQDEAEEVAAAPLASNQSSPPPPIQIDLSNQNQQQQHRQHQYLDH